MAAVAVHKVARCKQARFSRTVTPQPKVSLGGCSRPSMCCASSSDGKVIPDPSYAIPGVLLGLAVASLAVDAKPVAAITGILGIFLTIQATRVKFIFDKEALEIIIGETEEEQPENAFVGGESKWKFDSFVNWEFWWPNFPVLVYFKETQTKPEGQIHFFPIIFDGKTLYETMLDRCGKTQNSGPKE